MIETSRLLLRPLDGRDLEPLWALWSDPRVRAHLIAVPQTRDEFVAMFTTMRGLPALWAVCDRTSGVVIGRCGFYAFGAEQTPELAYLLGPAWWGRGLATEMAGAALRHAFVDRDWPKVVALILPGNAPSLGVARKLGFVHERDVEVRGKLAQLHRIRRESVPAG